MSDNDQLAALEAEIQNKLSLFKSRNQYSDVGRSGKEPGAVATGLKTQLASGRATENLA
ncbi:MAG: hypothetical protein QOH41_1637 [Blastocatellia bacterium]|jgi:hypothetical protein|nr:hypothetical protein [Blastocatellia bacterium]